MRVKYYTSIQTIASDGGAVKHEAVLDDAAARANALLSASQRGTLARTRMRSLRGGGPPLTSRRLPSLPSPSPALTLPGWPLHNASGPRRFFSFAARHQTDAVVSCASAFGVARARWPRTASSDASSAARSASSRSSQTMFIAFLLPALASSPAFATVLPA